MDDDAVEVGHGVRRVASPGVVGTHVPVAGAGCALLERVVRAVDVRVTLEGEHRPAERQGVVGQAPHERLVLAQVGLRLPVEVPHVRLLDHDETLRVSGRRDREGAVQPAQVGGGALPGRGGLLVAHRRRAVPGSVSLFEPPGMSSVTNTKPLRCQITFSTYWASSGCAGSYAAACE